MEVGWYLYQFYLEMSYFLPFYTENAAYIYGLIFFLTNWHFFYLWLYERMRDVKIKCLCLKYVEIDLEQCSKHHTFARIVTLVTQIIIIWLCKQLGEQCIFMTLSISFSLIKVLG